MDSHIQKVKTFVGKDCLYGQFRQKSQKLDRGPVVKKVIRCSLGDIKDSAISNRQTEIGKEASDGADI